MRERNREIIIDYTSGKTVKTLSSFLKKERLKSGEFHMAKNEGNTRHMLGKYVVVIRGTLSHFSV